MADGMHQGIGLVAVKEPDRDKRLAQMTEHPLEIGMDSDFTHLADRAGRRFDRQQMKFIQTDRHGMGQVQ